MALTHFASKNKKIKIVLNGKNLVTSLAQIGIVISMMIALGFVAARIESFVVVLSIAIIPILACVFIIKLLVWNWFGTETIELTKKSLSVFHDYKYVYKSWKNEHEINNPKLTFQTLSDGVVSPTELDKISEVVPMKIVITPNNEDSFTSSFSISKNDSEQLIYEFNKLYNIKEEQSTT